MPVLVSLRWKLLGWFFLNLAVVLTALFVFLRWEFSLGIASVLSGAAGDHLETLAHPLAEDMRRLPPAAWNEAWARTVEPHLSEGVQAAVIDDQGEELVGKLPFMPSEVSRFLVHPPPGPAGQHPPSPPPSDAPGGIGKFVVTTDNPRLYWAGVYLQNIGPTVSGSPPHMAALVLASSTLRGGGLLFDYVPWMLFGGGLLLVSICLWLPFIRRLTRGLRDMTQAAERIAEGSFQAPRTSRRNDELGRLGRALADMASRLEGHVTGQKRFLGDTAHELLSPLARLEVGLSILEERGAGTDPAIVERSLGEVRHLASIVQDLLLFTKSELRAAPVVLTTIPLAAMARSVARREAVGEVKVNVNVSDDLCALADRDLLDRALSNAVRNAVRYAGHAGPITIFAASGEHAPEEVRLTVLDEGPGAPEATLKKIIRPVLPAGHRTHAGDGWYRFGSSYRQELCGSLRGKCHGQQPHERGVGGDISA